MCTVLHIAVIWSNYMEMFAILLKCVCLNITSPEELVHINGGDSLFLIATLHALKQVVIMPISLLMYFQVTSKFLKEDAIYSPIVIATYTI